MRQQKTKWKQRIKFFMMALVLVWGLNTSLQVHAATEAQKKAFKQELLDMFMNVDATTHNIYQYNLNLQEFNECYDSVARDEGSIIYGSYPYDIVPAYSILNSRMKTVTLEFEDNGIKERYKKMCVVVDEILAGIEPEMTDLDKVLYLHDWVVEHTVYGGSSKQIYMPGGVLVEGKAVCSGYARALNLLLHQAGFEQSYVRNASLSHGWTYVKLDNEWYHIDPTWDDTRSPKSGQTSRTHFLKNDAEFLSNHGPKWDIISATGKSTSTKYSSLFLRNVVGKMIFEDGYWYYYDAGIDAIMKGHLKNNTTALVIDCSSFSGEQLVDVDGNVITMLANGYTYSVEVGKDGVISGGNAEEISIPALSELDLSDISNWRSGVYHYQTGFHTFDSSRIALKSYASCDANTEYQIAVSNSKYQVLVRELNGNMSLIASHDLKSGGSFTTKSATKYVAISIYSPSVSGLSFAKYEDLFKDGFEVSITTEEQVEEDEESSLPEIEEGIIIIPGVSVNNSQMYIPSLNGVDLNNIANWKSGMYHYQTGLHTAYSGRICLNSYVLGESGTEYRISISNSKYNVLIRELDSNKKLVASHDLKDGKSFTTKSSTAYLAISIYCPSNSNVSYDEYAALFENGLTLAITEEGNTEDVVVEVQPVQPDRDAGNGEKIVEAWNFRNFGNWKSGMYNYTNGKYCVYDTRICLVDYLEFDSASYYANISNSAYKLIVRELDENQKFVKTVILEDGANYIPSANAKYLGISLYNVAGEAGMSYTKFRQMFADGFYAELIAK